MAALGKFWSSERSCPHPLVQITTRDELTLTLFEIQTINVSCLVEQGYLSVCLEEIQQYPFIGAQKMFAAAFLSDDPAEVTSYQ